MINLENLRLEDIAPDSIKIPDVLAFFNALDPELQKITQDVSEVLLMTRIDELPEELVDLLAWQFHVDFYEPLGLDLNKKRALVKKSLIWHRYRGTKYAVEEIVRTLFFEDFRVEEWFEYDGRPYFFRAVIGSQPAGRDDLDEVIGAIYATKNERSWLDYVVFEQDVESNMYLAGVVEDDISELFSTSYQPDYIETTLYIGVALEDYIADVFSDPLLNDINTTAYIAGAICEHIAETFIANPSDEITHL